MNARQIVTPLILGCALIALGLIPGLMSDLMDAIQRFRDSLSSFPAPARQPVDAHSGQRVPGQAWLVAWGTLLILLSLLLYLTN